MAGTTRLELATSAVTVKWSVVSDRKTATRMAPKSSFGVPGNNYWTMKCVLAAKRQRSSRLNALGPAWTLVAKMLEITSATGRAALCSNERKTGNMLSAWESVQRWFNTILKGMEKRSFPRLPQIQTGRA
jgi:hypothetical protein